MSTRQVVTSDVFCSAPRTEQLGRVRSELYQRYRPVGVFPTRGAGAGKSESFMLDCSSTSSITQHELDRRVEVGARDAPERVDHNLTVALTPQYPGKNVLIFWRRYARISEIWSRRGTRPCSRFCRRKLLEESYEVKCVANWTWLDKAACTKKFQKRS